MNPFSSENKLRQPELSFLLTLHSAWLITKHLVLIALLLSLTG